MLIDKITVKRDAFDHTDPDAITLERTDGAIPVFVSPFHSPQIGDKLGWDGVEYSPMPEGTGAIRDEVAFLVQALDELGVLVGIQARQVDELTLQVVALQNKPPSAAPAPEARPNPCALWVSLCPDGSIDPLSHSETLQILLGNLEALTKDRTGEIMIAKVVPKPGTFWDDCPVSQLIRIETAPFAFDGREKLRPAQDVLAGRITDDHAT